MKKKENKHIKCDGHSKNKLPTNFPEFFCGVFHEAYKHAGPWEECLMKTTQTQLQFIPDHLQEESGGHRKSTEIDNKGNNCSKIKL